MCSTYFFVNASVHISLVLGPQFTAIEHSHNRTIAHAVRMLDGCLVKPTVKRGNASTSIPYCIRWTAWLTMPTRARLSTRTKRRGGPVRLPVSVREPSLVRAARADFSSNFEKGNKEPKLIWRSRHQQTGRAADVAALNLTTFAVPRHGSRASDLSEGVNRKRWTRDQSTRWLNNSIAQSD
ncbi:hypothetical protein BKA81DRAFT_107244 [Phyllosticta paracitricarpa]